ncbi:MAG: HD domain-containing protein [Chloroflexi bacterium]|nr:HD domain-containing protein [Chloroflexota bacterium]
MPPSRARQFWRHLVVRDADLRHAERTASILRAGGADEELVLAGLLHDRAKPAEARLWHRVAATLLEGTAERWAPGCRARLARGEGTFARYLDHARRGAELSRAEGRSARVVRLIARHHLVPQDDDERRLAAADALALP